MQRKPPFSAFRSEFCISQDVGDDEKLAPAGQSAFPISLPTTPAIISRNRPGLARSDGTLAYCGLNATRPWISILDDRRQSDFEASLRTGAVIRRAAPSTIWRNTNPETAKPAGGGP